MPPLVAAPLITAAVIGGGAMVSSAVIGSRAAGSAAKKETEAATHAADVAAQSNREALDFQKQQAKQELARAEAAQHANYDQWAARQRRLSNLSVLTGAGTMEIPDYRPIPVLPDADASATTPGAPPPSGPPAPGGTPPPGTVPVGRAVPRPGTTGSNVVSMADAIGPPTQYGRGRYTPPGTRAVTAGTGGSADMVLLKAPTGATRLMPRSQADQYLARGAQIVG